jgi:REP element-mobilizing transposase RayT
MPLTKRPAEFHAGGHLAAAGGRFDSPALALLWPFFLAKSAAARLGLRMKASTSPLHYYRVRFRGLPAALGTDILFDKIINCFKRHPRNLYDSPDFVLCDLARFGRNLDLLVNTSSKHLLLQRLRRLNFPFSSLRCRPIQLSNWNSNHGFAAWLVPQYGLDSSDPGRRRVRVNQRRPIGNNLTYHVWNRTTHRRLLFGPAEKDLILHTILNACAQWRIQLHAFVILGNHFHMALTTQNDVSISQLMGDIDWHITTRYNKLHKTSGTLWQGPFKHSLWEATPANMLRLIDYLHANPLRAGLCTDPDAYGWSSYTHYSGARRRKTLVVPLCLRRRYPRRPMRQIWYKGHFADCYRSGKLQSDPEMGKVGVVGSPQFVKTMTRQLADPLRLPAFVPGALKLARQRVIWGLKTLLHLLCKPLVDAWFTGQTHWKQLTERLEPLVPVPEAPA